MAKKESTVIEKVKFVFYIIIGSIIIGTALFGVDRHYAKTSEVNAAVSQSVNGDKSLNQRIEIGILDGQIFQQEQTIQRIEDWQRYAQRKEQPVLTPIEKETLQKAKTRKAQLENRKEDKIKAYENRGY